MLLMLLMLPGEGKHNTCHLLSNDEAISHAAYIVSMSAGLVLVISRSKQSICRSIKPTFSLPRINKTNRLLRSYMYTYPTAIFVNLVCHTFVLKDSPNTTHCAYPAIQFFP